MRAGRNAVRRSVALLGFLQAMAWANLVHAQEAPAAAEAQYAPGGADTCLLCHGERAAQSATGILETVHAVAANTRTPFAGGNHACQACHGPSAVHLRVGSDGVRPPPPVTFKARQDATIKNAPCLDCHNRDVATHWAGSAHQYAEAACSDCHRLHDAVDAVRELATQADVCFDCHRRERADFFRHTTHPVREGLLACVDCHQPHGSAGPALLHATTLNQTCYECHAEKRGPFLWEHAPVQEDCSECHMPHGSNHAALLQARTPWLCQQCHLAQFHPSTALSGTGRPPLGASQNLLGKDCLNCHTAVHGSNHPSGARLIR